MEVVGQSQFRRWLLPVGGPPSPSDLRRDSSDTPPEGRGEGGSINPSESSRRRSDNGDGGQVVGGSQEGLSLEYALICLSNAKLLLEHAAHASGSAEPHPETSAAATAAGPPTKSLPCKRVASGNAGEASSADAADAKVRARGILGLDSSLDESGSQRRGECFGF